MTDPTSVPTPEWLPDFDVMNDAGHHDDPYPNYEQLRARCPVARSERHGGYWIVSRHEDISHVLREVDVFSSRRIRIDDANSGMLGDGLRTPDGLDLGKPISLSLMDPPEHTGFRRLLVPLFSARRVREWEPAMREAAVALCERMKDLERCDFTAQFATEFPILIFLDILGVPHEDRQLMRELHDKLALVPQGLLSPQEAQPYQVQELSYYARLVAADDPDGPAADTVVRWLNRARVDDRPLTLQEKIRLCQQFARAGLHTTSSALSNMICYLAAHPDRRDRLVEDPGLSRTAVEELLRFESIAMPARQVVVDTELGGQQIRAGEMVVLPLASAGRDEDVFDDPGEVSFDRQSINHLAFGVGRHKCVGLHLARAELRIALEVFHRYFPRYRLTEGRRPVRHSGAVRTTNELWIDLDADRLH